MVSISICSDKPGPW